METKYFSYNKVVPLAISICILSFIVGINITSVYLLSRDIPLPVLVVLNVVMVIFLVVIGISPMLTYREITGKYLIIRQGLPLKVHIPLENIVSVSKTTDKLYIFGSRYVRGKMYIQTYWKNLVNIELDEPMKFRLLAFGTPLKEFVINVNDPDEFIAILKKRVENVKKQIVAMKYRRKKSKV